MKNREKTIVISLCTSHPKPTHCFFLFSPFRSAKTTVRPALSATGGSEIMLSEIYMKETLIPAPLLPHGGDLRLLPAAAARDRDSRK